MPDARTIRQLPLMLVLATALCAAASAQEADDTPLTSDAPVAAEEQLESPAAAGTNYDDEITLLFQRFDDMLNNGLFDEAEVIAKQLVELSIREHGQNHRDIAAALVNLGISQYRLEQYELAELNFEAAIRNIERADDRLSPMLVNPLKGLGATQVKLGEPVKALDTFDRAVHITHVNDGPQNLEQVEILDSMSEIFLGLGDAKEATNMQERAFDLFARRTDPDSEDLIPALFRLGEWQARMYQVADMKNTYLRIIRIVEKNHGDNSMALIKPLIKLGQSFLYDDPNVLPATRGLMASYGEVYLKRALKIVLKNPEATWRDRVEILLELGDYYTISDNPGRARKRYVAAWKMLSTEEEQEEKLALRAAELEVPVRQKSVVFPDFAGEMNPRDSKVESLFKRGYYDLEFIVTQRGLVDDVRIVEANPAGLEEMEKDVIRAARQMVYRPMFVAGEAVDAANQTYHHEFVYREMDLPEESPRPATEDETGAR